MPSTSQHRTSSAGIAIRGLRKSFGPSIRAVQDFQLEVASGEFVVLLGPSGCGKTTVLRSIAGLETPDSGEIEIGGQLVFSSAARVNIPPERRGVGMVFQSYAIWPHMTVAQNVAYPLERKRVHGPELAREVDSLLEIVALQGYGSRPATALSGGQQQRTAVARALAGGPRAMLFDEPLSNLDAKLRDHMRVELRRLHRAQGYTGLYVTHDQFEALGLADRVVIMRDGAVEQVGAPMEVYARPRNRFVADFLGACNFLPATVVAVDALGTVVSCPLGAVRVTDRDVPSVGQAVTLGVRPSAFRMDDVAESSSASVGATVVAAIYRGESFQYVLDLGNGVTVQTRGPSERPRSEGERVCIGLDPTARVFVLPD